MENKINGIEFIENEYFTYISDSLDFVVGISSGKCYRDCIMSKVHTTKEDICYPTYIKFTFERKPEYPIYLSQKEITTVRIASESDIDIFKNRIAKSNSI